MKGFLLVLHTPQMESVRAKRQYAPKIPDTGDYYEVPPYTLSRRVTSRLFKTTRADPNTKYVQVRIEVSTAELLEALTTQDGWHTSVPDL